jgi:vitamin B12 transporter
VDKQGHPRINFLIGPGIFFAVFLIVPPGKNSTGGTIMKTYYPVLLCQLFAGSFAQAGLATESGQPQDMMDEVVVTASRSSESKKEVSSHITVIDREALQQSASRNVGELLAEKGLGHIQKYPGNLTSIGIRGFRTDTHGNDLQGHVLILLDGRRAGTGNVAKLLTKNVERLEIIRGPGAVQYGSAGMGGVVNIITRQGNNNSAFIEGGAGSYGRGEGSIGGTVKEKGFDFAGAYSYGTSGDYDTGSNKGYDNTDIDDETGISANGGYSFSDHNRIGIIFTGFNVDEAGNPGYFSAIDHDDSTNKENYSVDTNYSGGSSTGKYHWMARYFFGKDENSWLDPIGSDPSGWDNGIASTNKTDQQGAQAQFTGKFGSATLTTGFDWLDYEVENSWTPRETSYTNPAVFLLGKISFLEDRLTANVGLRYDWYNVQVSEPAGRNEDQSRLTPKIGLAWTVREGLKIRVQYAEGFMMPSADQLAADFTSFGTRVVGNADLGAEKSTTYEGGLDFSHNGLNTALTWFSSKFRDKISTDYLPDGSKTWKNLGEATISGIETELSYDLGEPLAWDWELRPYVNLTYLTQYEDEETGDDLQYISDTTLAAGIVTSNGAGTFCRLNVTYTGSQDVQDWESGIYPTPVNKLGSVSVADLTAAYRFLETENYGTFTVRGEVTNLFNEDYAYVKGYPMPGRGFFVNLRWDY